MRRAGAMLVTVVLGGIALGQQQTGSTGEATRPPTVSVKEGEDHLITWGRAEYPPVARAAHVSGTVVVGVEINTEGKVTQAVVLSGPEMLRWTALKVAGSNVYRPFERDGKPAVVRTAVPVLFRNFTFTVEEAGGTKK